MKYSFKKLYSLLEQQIISLPFWTEPTTCKMTRSLVRDEEYEKLNIILTLLHF